MLIAELGKEPGQAEFGDTRLSKRLAGIAESTGNQSNASFPSAMKPRAELEACYRFFDNPKHRRFAYLDTNEARHRRSQRERKALGDSDRCRSVDPNGLVPFGESG